MMGEAKNLGAPPTRICNVAVFVPVPSVTETTQLFVNVSFTVGVPDSAPLAATFNQAGPLTFAKVIGSPSASEAESARVWPA